MIFLENTDVTVQIAEPWEVYQGSRFSQTGFITSFKYRGVELCGAEEETEKKERIGQGLCGEFGIFTPIGYEQCAAGDFFIKPGVGSLQKKEGMYHFYEEFVCKPEMIRVEKEKDQVVFYTESEMHNGFGMRTKKCITLEGTTLRVEYRLENTGSQTIRTEEYCHNFIRIGKGSVREDYSIHTGGITDLVEIPEIFCTEGEVLCPKRELEDVYYVRMKPRKRKPYRWQIWNQRAEIGIEECTSFQPEYIAFWGKRSVASVEAFKKIHLKPGESETYSRIYSVLRGGIV